MLPRLISRSDSREDLLPDMIGNLKHPALQDYLWRVGSINVGSSLDDRHISLRCWWWGNETRLFGFSFPTRVRCRAPLGINCGKRLPSDALQTYEDLRTMLICLQSKEILKMGRY